jgi:hypothetical protein
MNKVFNVIVIAVVLFLLFKGMTVALRFWYIWVAVIIFFAIKRRYFSKSDSKESKDFVDADFTIIDDDDNNSEVEENSNHVDE